MKTLEEFIENLPSFKNINIREFTFVKNYDVFVKNEIVRGINTWHYHEIGEKFPVRYRDFYVVYKNEQLYIIPREYVTKNSHE